MQDCTRFVVLDIEPTLQGSQDHCSRSPGLDHIFIWLGLVPPTPPSLPALPARNLHGNSLSLGTNVTILGQNYKKFKLTLPPLFPS